MGLVEIDDYPRQRRVSCIQAYPDGAYSKSIDGDALLSGVGNGVGQDQDQPVGSSGHLDRRGGGGSEHDLDAKIVAIAQDLQFVNLCRATGSLSHQPGHHQQNKAEMENSLHYLPSLDIAPPGVRNYESPFALQTLCY